MSRTGKLIGCGLVTVVAIVGMVGMVGVGGYLYVSNALHTTLTTVYETHQDVDFPIPWPLTQAEIDALSAPELADLQVIATDRAVARGQHLTTARYACVACHGADYSGGIMVEDAVMGLWQGKNLTAGSGSATAQYSPRDWDRIIRHGVKPDGTAAIMPSDDFTLMSDQELSDIIVFMRSLPAVNNQVADPTFGPVSSILIGTGQVPMSAFKLHTNTDHPSLPPEAMVTAEFGRHLAGVCHACHRPGMEGGPIKVGPPDWPPATNLTTALDGYTYEQFDAMMRTGERPDGTTLAFPMSDMPQIAQHTTQTEMRAMWTYLSSLEARPTGQ